MRLLIAFLIVMFVVGGITRPSQPLRRPLFVLCTSVVVGAMFYSRRIL